MSVARSVPGGSKSLVYPERWAGYRYRETEFPMTLIFALLREDHIVFASDRRHVTGNIEERYINDHGWKTEKILGNTAMLGFAGNDFVEQIVSPLKRQGALESNSLEKVAKSVSHAAKEKYEAYANSCGPLISFYFLLAGFQRENKKSLATVYKIDPGSFYPFETCWDQNSGRSNFELIGKQNHGALYALHKCAAYATGVEAGVQLAYFTLKEVTRYDTSVGGPPEICIIRPDREIEDRSDGLEAHARWADEVGERIRTLIVSPMPEASQSQSKRGQ